LKKEVLKNVGLLDENIFYAPEDVDYCLRIWLAGYKVVYNSEVSAIHHAQEISRGLKINRATINHIKGLAYYFKKHKYILKCPIRSHQI
jgi:GT2 family glycosyltransferase